MIESVYFWLLILLALLLAVPLGKHMNKVYSGEKAFLYFLTPFERGILKLSGISTLQGMSWKQYLGCFLAVNAIWLVWGFVILLCQGSLFLNPAGNPSLEWTLALNSAISFLTSTNLQHYSGETGATYLSQIVVFSFLQFMSAAASLCAGVAIVRGLKKDTNNLGNFWQDFVWSITRILLPICFIFAILFMVGGMPMTFNGPHILTSLQGDTVTVAKGPVAGMIPIKELGSNGGGYFGANDAHPFENPSIFSYGIHTIIVLLLPTAFVFFVGYHLRQRKFAYMVLGVMIAGLLLVTLPIIWQELKGNPAITQMGISNTVGNLEGKEARFGTLLTAAYCGENVAVPAGTIAGMHDSFMPLSGVFMLVGMQIDAFFGGLGTGFINFLVYFVTALFIATLMIGRTPEILGKKISIREMQLAVGVNIIQVGVPLVLTAIACVVFTQYPGGNDALGWLSNPGPHGFTTFLYEYISGGAGNGSGFEGLGDNTPYWNLTTSIPMLTGRFAPIVGMLALVGVLQKKPYVASSSGTLKIDTFTFGAYTFLIILILNALYVLPAFMLGPASNHLQH